MPSLRRLILSLRLSLLLAVLAAVVLPALAAWHLDGQAERAAAQPQWAQQRLALLNATAAALEEALWSADAPGARHVAEQAMADATLLQVHLINGAGDRLILAAARSGRQPTPPVLLGVDIERTGQPLGRLEMAFDPDPPLPAGQVARGAGLWLLAWQCTGASLLVLAALYWRGERPLRGLRQQLDDQQQQHAARVVELEAERADLQRIALYDALTGLPNRSLFQELLGQAVLAARRDNGQLALLFIDLDRFKAVNDSIGHDAGDELLKAVAGRLRGTLRESDLVCRYSGDEFVVLLRDARHWDAVANTADRLLKAIEAPVPLRLRDVQVSASIGIALFPDDAADPESLVRSADTAMYESKNLGRARVSFFRAEFNSQLHASLQLEQELQTALAEDQFVLHYQPQVDSHTGRLLGCEALIRWQHPERGMVSPLQFIGAAEQCGLISELGSWTIRHACAQIERWKRDGVPFGSVAVNVSALEFRHHRLVDTLTQAMLDFDVRPHELEIEITEGVLMTDTETTQRILADLHQLGLGLAVDDFGTGYSSLAYLKRLRPTKIKIDRSFVNGLPDDEDDRVLVNAVVHLASALGIQVVAEGVETAAQRIFLRDSHCGVLQGYLIARPQPADEFALFACQEQHRPLPAEVACEALAD